MTTDTELVALKQLVQVQPAQIQGRADSLRKQSLQCADLAADCVTDDAKLVLSRMAEEFGEEADQLENALHTIHRLYAEAFENGAAPTAEQ